MAITLKTKPIEQPLTKEEVKLHLRVDFDEDDSLIKILIPAATQYAEKYMRRALITQTWTLFLDDFPPGSSSFFIDQSFETLNTEIIIIPLPPLQSITTVKYIDNDGVQQTLAASDFQFDKESDPARLAPSFSKTWPITRNQLNAVEIEFITGYGLAVSVPEPIKQGLFLIIGHWYENREQVVIGKIPKELMKAVDALWWAYRPMEVR